MSDAFADLWSSSAPPKKPPLRQSPSNPSSRPPSSSSLFNTQPRHSPVPNYNRPIQHVKPTVASGPSSEGDPFGALLSGSPAGSALNGGRGKLTIAEMAAQAQQDRLDKAVLSENRQSQTNGVGPDALWAGLDTLGASHRPSLAPATAGATSKHSLLDDGDDWEFGAPPSIPPSAPQHPPSRPSSYAAAGPDDTFGLNDFSTIAKPSPAAPALTSNSSGGSIWDALDAFQDPCEPSPHANDNDDLDDLGFGPIPSVPPHPPTTLQRADSPSQDFDFGNREYANASPLHSVQPTQPSGFRRVPSPPPHILGQLVEMGFMPDKAKNALVSSYRPSSDPKDADWDIEGAITSLISGGRSIRHASEPDRRGSPDPYLPRVSSGRPPKPQPHIDSTRDGSMLSGPARNDSPSQSSGDLLSQASEIGMTMFNRANLFWNTKGREMKDKVVDRVVKVYEETAGTRSAASLSRSGSGRGRPRWMQDGAEHLDVGPPSFKDSNDEDALPRRPTGAQLRKEASDPSEPQVRRPTAPEVDIFSSDAPSTSPFRRGKSKPTPANAPSATASAPSLPLHHATLPPPQPRPSLISCSPSTLSQSSQHKSKGTELFKLGQYADAHTAYTHAIEILPLGHVCRVPLYNNRALASSRMGDVKGAIIDSGRALHIICGVPESNYAGGLSDLDPASSSSDPDRSQLTFDPRKEAKISNPEEGSAVDLGGMWIKASKRRAEAFEEMEKWAEAKNDWELILGAGDWVGESVRREAVGAAGRCKQMLDGGTQQSISRASTNTAMTTSRPLPRHARPAPTKPSAALNALRAATNQAEAEANQRHELKDVVDAKLLAWKGGKESNIRALIASLDSVLWAELGWNKVGMGELVTENQVKVRYMRAIAKVHPDKITTSSATLEQRMVANGVFGALNEAWNAFKP